MDPYLGEIRLFAGNYAPEGWALCNGQLVSVSEYQALFALIGTTYGGNGQSTFGLPNLKGAVVVGSGTGPNLPTYVAGQQGGLNNVTPTVGEIPAHSHALNGINITATDAAPAGLFPAAAGAGFYTPPNSAGFATHTLAAATVGPGGGNAAHDNNMPTITLASIIALNGLYPQEQ